MKNKKKILFIINNMNIGGSEKALISLLCELDYSEFEVDLQLFKHEGPFLSEVPKEVNVLDVPRSYQYFDCSFQKVIGTLNPNLIFNRYRFSRILKKANSPAEAEQLAWKFLAKSLPPLEKEYDVAVGYLEKNPIYFAVDKVRAKKKIGFIHNDYRNIQVNKEIDRPYFQKLDYICSVSHHCVEILKADFPFFIDKIKLIPNLFSEKLILKNASEPIIEIDMSRTFFNIVSIGRLAEQKGFDLSIEAASILKQKNFKFKWFILGEGALREILQKRITELNLEDCFFLLGNQSNPYKYMKTADLIVQTSRFEGKSIALDEAKILNKVILATNYPTVNDQITENIDGCICGFSPDEIAERIMSIANNSSIKENIIQYLKTHRQKNNNKLLELL